MKRNYLALVLTPFLLAACDRQVEPAGEVPASPAAMGVAPAEPGRDLATLDLCELLPVSEVAEITGERLAGTAHRQDMGDSQGCTYGVPLVTGGATADRISVWAQPPTMFENADSILDNATGLGHDAMVEPVLGMGQQAFMLSNTGKGTYTVHVLRQGELSLMATAKQPEHAIAMAQVTLERLGLPVAEGTGEQPEAEAAAPSAAAE